MPTFNSDGVLPAGDYPLTLKELRQSHLVTGADSGASAWDSAWRLQLVDNLALMAAQLWVVGITELYVDGSFVKNKERPDDIDGYFAADVVALATGSLVADLNHFGPDAIWTWAASERWVGPDSPKAQLPMWHKYRVELYPYVPGFPSGITDRFGNALEFPAAFRQSRQGKPKGIIILEKGD